MKFRLSSSASFFLSESTEVNRLKELGFEFIEQEGLAPGKYYHLKWHDVDPIYIEINNIRELMLFIEKYGQIIIVGD